jgi:hypothetical protein
MIVFYVVLVFEYRVRGKTGTERSSLPVYKNCLLILFQRKRHLINLVAGECGQDMGQSLQENPTTVLRILHLIILNCSWKQLTF